MNGKLCKVWNNEFKKAVMAQSLKELVFKGSKKLNIENETVKVFLQDGTEIDDEKVYRALPSGVVVYLLTDSDKKPWDEAHHANGTINCHSSFDSTSLSVPQKAQVATEWCNSLIISTSSFSVNLKRDVKSGDLSWLTKRELLGVICEEIEKHTFSPTVSQRDAVARQLVKQFPKLKSNIGEGHESWSLKIYDRMKNNFKRATNFPCKRKADSENSKLKHSSRVKHPRIIPRMLEKGNKIVDEAKKMMAIEMKKIPSKRDIVDIQVGLSVSFADRKRLIESNIPLDYLQNEYPAIFTVFGIAYDFNATYNIDLEENILMSLHSCSSAVLEYAEKKKKKNLQMLKNEVYDNVNSLLVMTTILIPEILGENREFLYKVYPVEFELQQLKETPLTPHLCVIGDPFFSSEIYIVGENKILVECCDFLEGIATLIGIYYVFNIQYPIRAMATYKFFQSYILKLPCKNLPGKLITFCKALP